MRKIPFMLLFLTCILQAIAQDKTVAQLKQELDEHPQQDAARVDRLNNLSLNSFFSVDERKKFMKEALAVSQKIKYPTGEATAMAAIAYYKAIDGNVQEADSLMNLAWALAEKIGDPNLTGLMFYRIGMKKVNTAHKEGMDDLFKAEMILAGAKNYDKLTHCQASIASM